MTPRRERLLFLSAVAALAALALVLYRPWIDRPFDTLDFSEFLPLLTGNGTIVGRTLALTRYYAGDHGRLNVASYAALALKWTVLGPSPVLWQWARAVELALLTAGTYLVLRRLALRPFPALGGASLFVATRLVNEGWTRMTLGEPLGMLLALGALLLVPDRRQHDRIGRAVWSGVLLMGAVLAKEMLIGLLPVVWLVGFCRTEEGAWAPPPPFRSIWRPLFWCSLPPLAAFAAASVVALGGGSAGFTALYGHAPLGAGVWLDLLTRPWSTGGLDADGRALTVPVNLLFPAVTLVGLGLAWQRPALRPRLRFALAVGGVTTLAFAVLYLPWPYRYLYYAIPFLLGPALLFGTALQAYADHPRHGALAAILGWTTAVAPGLPDAHRATSFTIAMQQVNGDLVTTLARVPYADGFVVARVGTALQPWIGAAATLRRYGSATGRGPALPPGRDITCDQIGDLLGHRLGRTIFVTYLGNCGGLQAPSAHVVRRYPVVDVRWSGWKAHPDSVVVDILVDREAMTPRPSPAATPRSPAPRTD